MERVIEVAKVKDIIPGGAKLIHFGYQSVALLMSEARSTPSMNTVAAMVDPFPRGH